MSALTGVNRIGPDLLSEKRRRLVIFFANTPTERSVLEAVADEYRQGADDDHPSAFAWVRESDDGDSLVHENLEEGLRGSDDLELVPVGIAWAPKSGGRQSWRDLMAWLRTQEKDGRQKEVLKKAPHRCAIVTGEPGDKSVLVNRYKRATGEDNIGSGSEFADFVALQAALTVERDSRAATRETIKLPRLVRRSIWARQDFQTRLTAIAEELGRPLPEVQTEARQCLKELVPTVRAPHVRMAESFMRTLCRLGYEDKIYYDEERMKEIRSVTLSTPTALLFTHKTHVDGAAMVAAAGAESFPLLHVIGGDNMAFFGIGYLMRRAGAVFIRRSTADSPVYKACLRYYLAFLLEKRFPVSWALEGTRSRNGKLMPPRFGILKYVVEAAAKNNVSELNIIPVSIYYDLIAELGDYAAEQTGAEKRKESLLWFTGYLRSLRKPLGRISMAFGDPVVVDTTTPEFAAALAGSDDQFSVALQKIAFEASVSANTATPINASALIALCLTGAAPQALTEAEFAAGMRELRDWAHARDLPMTDDLANLDAERIRGIVTTMIDIGVLHRFDEGPDTVYSVAQGQHFAASYYRNTSIHVFVNKAIAEIALIAAAEAREAPLDAFWTAATNLRDLFKFEFFYPETEEFRTEIAAEVARYDEDWEASVGKGGAETLLRRLRPHVSHAVLRPFAEAYAVVADVLLSQSEPAIAGEKDVIDNALKLAKQSLLQRRITSEESIGKLMFANAYKLASNRGLLDMDQRDPKGARVRFAKETKDIANRIRRVGDLATHIRNGEPDSLVSLAVDNAEPDAAAQDNTDAISAEPQQDSAAGA